MSAVTEYLEAAKIDELAAEFRRAGYSVHSSHSSGNTQYDLVAEQGSRKIAVEVVARLALRDDTIAEKVHALREQAHNQGFTEFRLVLVSPPREATVEVEGLETLLLDAIVNTIPSELDSLSSHTRVLGISDIDIASTMIGKDGIRATGTGIVLVELEYGGGEEKDGINEDIDFPFFFDIVLTQDLELQDVTSLTVDTSSFYR